MIGYFHNHAYRHILRSPSCYQEFKGLKHAPRTKWWDRKYYYELLPALVEAGLCPEGFSRRHTAVIARVMRYDLASLMDTYHN